MSNKFSQSAFALVNSEKAKWAELQFLNAVDQLILAQDEIEKLKSQLDEANKRIAQLAEKGEKNNGN